MTTICQVPLRQLSPSPTARAGGSRRGRSGRPRRCASRGLDQHAAGGEIRAGHEARPAPRSCAFGMLDQMQPARRTSRRHCAAGWRSPCRRRCPARRWPAGSGRPPAAPPAPAPRRHRWRGNRRRPRRCRPAAAAATRGQPRLGVAHGRGVIAVDVAEIALPVDQRIAHGEILRQTHQRVVDRRRRRAGGICRSRRRRRGRIS